MGIPIAILVGKSGCGKTILLEKLVIEMKSRNYRLAKIKHHSHRGFEIDRPGKGSWRFARAGSDHVVIAATDKIAFYRKIERELPLDEIAAGINDVDLILVEGYRQAGKPALEIMRAEVSRDLIGSREQRFAVAANFTLDPVVPQVGLADVLGIADLVERRFRKQS
jgi:molybdopterin-guanine dinucleotide biosynthesis protein B